MSTMKPAEHFGRLSRLRQKPVYSPYSLYSGYSFFPSRHGDIASRFPIRRWTAARKVFSEGQWW